MANEKRLIDVNAALEKVCANCGCDFEECQRIGFCSDYMDIKQLPTVDAVEVVRCKNCKYKGKLIDANERLYCCNYHSKAIMFENLYVTETDYCSAGKEKDNG